MSISATNGALAANASTMLSNRSTRNKVTPAPSAPGIACTAKVDTSVSNAGNPRLPATKPANSLIPVRKSAASALTCCALSDLDGKPSASSLNSVIPALINLAGTGHPHRSPAPQSRGNRHEMVVKTIVTAGVDQTVAPVLRYAATGSRS